MQLLQALLAKFVKTVSDRHWVFQNTEADAAIEYVFEGFYRDFLLFTVYIFLLLVDDDARPGHSVIEAEARDGLRDQLIHCKAIKAYHFFLLILQFFLVLFFF